MRKLLFVILMSGWILAGPALARAETPLLIYTVAHVDDGGKDFWRVEVYTNPQQRADRLVESLPKAIRGTAQYAAEGQQPLVTFSPLTAAQTDVLSHAVLRLNGLSGGLADHSAGIIALTIGLGALGLALFGAGFVAFFQTTKQRNPKVR